MKEETDESLFWMELLIEAGIIRDPYVGDGELISPEFFSPELSHQSHGVFAVRADDGSYTIVSVPWDGITQAVLKKVDKLPRGLFE